MLILNYTLEKVVLKIWLYEHTYRIISEEKAEKEESDSEQTDQPGAASEHDQGSTEDQSKTIDDLKKEELWWPMSNLQLKHSIS